MIIVPRHIGPEPEVGRVAGAFNAACLALALAQAFWPHPVVGAGCIAAPLVAICIAWRDERFVLFRETGGTGAELAGFLAPALIVGAWGIGKQTIIAPLAPAGVAGLLGLVLLIVIVKTDLEARRGEKLLFLAISCLAWSWGCVNYANVTFDHSRPERLVGTVFEYHTARNSPANGLKVEYAGQVTRIKRLRGRFAPGDRVYAEARRGALGWGYLRVPSE